MWVQGAHEVTLDHVYVKLSPSPHKIILHGHSHLMWAFSPHVHFTWAFPLHIHLVLVFSPHVHLTWAQGAHKVTLGYVYQVVPSMTKSHLMWPFSPCLGILTLLPPCILLHMKIISFVSHGKFPKKSQSNPNFINKVPLTSHQKRKECYLDLVILLSAVHTKTG